MKTNGINKNNKKIYFYYLINIINITINYKKYFK